MAQDLGFSEYKDYIKKKCSEETAGFMKKPPGKYKCGKPEPYPGCTVLATPYPVTSLVTQFSSLRRCLSNVQGFTPVPPNTYHMTVADLLSDNRYSTASGNKPMMDAFFQTVKEIIARHRCRTFDAQIVGIGAFPGVVVAFVDFTSEEDYSWIVRLRDAIFADPTVKNEGVERRFPFVGHLTLGYVESLVTNGFNADMNETRRAVNEMRQATPPVPMSFTIAGAALYSFPDMSRYDPI